MIVEDFKSHKTICHWLTDKQTVRKTQPINTWERKKSADGEEIVTGQLADIDCIFSAYFVCFS